MCTCATSSTSTGWMFLNFVIAANERTGIDIPEGDDVALATLDGCVEYVARAANY